MSDDEGWFPLAQAGGWLGRNRTVITMQVVFLASPVGRLCLVVLGSSFAARPRALAVGALSDAREGKGGGAIGRYRGGAGNTSLIKRWVLRRQVA